MTPTAAGVSGGGSSAAAASAASPSSTAAGGSGRFIAARVCGLPPTHPLRWVAITLLLWPWFSRLYVLVTLANSAVLGLFEASDPAQQGWRNSAIASSELPFTALYTLELAVKVAALGCAGRRGYLADRWHWLEAAVVASGWAALLPGAGALAPLRALRPLRLLAALSGPRVVMAAIAGSAAALVFVALIVASTLFVFAQMGLELWAGVLRGRCVYAEPPAAPGAPPAAVALAYPGAVSYPNAFCALPCSEYPAGSFCSASWGAACAPVWAYAGGNATLLPTSCRSVANPDYGATSWDNFLYAFLNTYTIITTESWSYKMYYLWGAWGQPAAVAVMNVVLIVVNSFVLLKLGVSDPPGWLTDVRWAMPALILMSVWGVGNSVVIYLAGLQDVPRELYEAADLDGASTM